MSDWQDIGTLPAEGIVLIAMERRDGGGRRHSYVAYRDEHKGLVDMETGRSMDNKFWRVYAWQHIPEPDHDSDCAVHNEPAYPKGPCSCKPASPPGTAMSEAMPEWKAALIRSACREYLQGWTSREVAHSRLIELGMTYREADAELRQAALDY